MLFKSRNWPLNLVLVGLAGCTPRPTINPKASWVDPKLLNSAKDHLEPGIVLYDEWGFKTGRLVKVYLLSRRFNDEKGGISFRRSGDKGDTYRSFHSIEKWLVDPKHDHLPVHNVPAEPPVP